MLNCLPRLQYKEPKQETLVSELPSPWLLLSLSLEALLEPNDGICFTLTYVSLAFTPLDLGSVGQDFAVSTWQARIYTVHQKIFYRDSRRELLSFHLHHQSGLQNQDVCKTAGIINYSNRTCFHDVPSAGNMKGCNEVDRRTGNLVSKAIFLDSVCQPWAADHLFGELFTEALHT